MGRNLVPRSRNLDPVTRLALAVMLALAWGAAARGQTTEKVVLVELFASQGCDLCPKAEQLLGKLAGDSRIAVVSFHVDYFNDPWKDPFADPRFSEREAEYSRIYDRTNKLNNPGYLYLTPLIMVDGQFPLVGSNADAESRARAAINSALRRSAELSLKVDVKSNTRSVVELEVRALPTGRKAVPKDLLLAAVLVQHEVRTAVESGELKGKSYNGKYVARSFRAEPAPGGNSPASLSLTLPADAPRDSLSLVVFAQEERTGRVLQAMRMDLPRPVE